MSTAVESMSATSPNVVKELRLNLNQLRLLRKSVSKTQDAEAKKLTRLSPHSKIHADVMGSDHCPVSITLA